MKTKPFAPSRSFQAIMRNFILMCSVFALTFASGANAGQSAAPKTSEQQNAATGPRIWLADNQELRVTHVGATANDQSLAQSFSAGRGAPIALLHADLDADGVEDLAVGYSTASGGAIVIHRGNLDAFAPQSDASFQAIGRGQFPSPFLAESKVFQVPVQPDFLVAGDFTGNGNVDLAIASRGGNALYILPGDGKGKFGSPQVVHLSGSVTTVGAERLKNGQGFTNLVVGLSSAKSSSILVLGRTQVGLGIVATTPIAAPTSSIAFGDLGDSSLDVFFLSGSELMVLHANSMQVEPLSLPVSAAAFAVGSFIYDRNPQVQLAVLGIDGSVQFAVHSEFDPRPFTIEENQSIRAAARRGFHNPLVPTKVVPKNGWKIVERIPGVASFSTSQIPTFLRARISDHGSDDVMIINGSGGKLSLVFHPDVAPGDSSYSPAQISTRPYSGSPVTAISSRVNVDGRPGIIAMHQGRVAPAVMMPLPDPTFTVNTTTDLVSANPNACLTALAGQCSLREAILEANATAGTDTIMVPAGTYTLTLAKSVGDFSGQHGALYVNDSVNIVGAGQATTIIQAGTLGQSSGTPNGVDMVMAVNEDISPLTNATASISNLTLQNGHNRGTSGNDGDGGCMEFDTGTSGNANLSLTNVTLNNCDTTQGSGGGIAIFNFTTPGSGTATLSNTTVQNNSAVNSVGGAAIGGGVWVSNPANMVMTGSLVTGNKTTQVVGTNAGSGAGVEAFTQSHTQIHASTISNNTAAGDGGGIEDLASLVVDQGTVISGNAAGNDGSSNNVGGGGIYYNGSSPDTLSLNKVTIINNTAAGNGGAIAVGNNSGGPTVTISFSRFVGNTSTLTPASNNIWNDDSTITATNNWWGSNTPATSIDNVHNGGGPSPVTTFDPFISFAITASPSSIASGQTSTLTAGFVQDNHGTAIAASNLDVLIGLPITFNNAILGALSAPQTAIQSSGQATAIFTAGATGGTGHADAKVDLQTVTANITILAPLQITKSFVPATVGVGVASTLTFSVNNPNSATQDSSFTDTLPAGLLVAATPSVTNTCGGTVTAVAGASSISFANANLAVGTCTITVHVSAAADGTFNNTVTINSTTAGTGAASTSSASLTVVAPPAIAKTFGASTIPLNGSTSLTFTVTNPNANTTLAGLAFTDSLPAGLVVATPNGLTSTCTGTATAVAGASAASLSGASLAPGASCTVSLNVAGTTAGVKNNSVQVTSTNGGTSNTSNASITVVGTAVIIKAFGSGSIPLNGATSLSFTIQNNNTTVSMTGVAFSDTLPAGLVISTPNGLTGTCGAGTITATAGSGTASLSGGTIAASSSCTFSVNVTGTTAGTKNNTTGNVTSTEGGTGGTASASINVVAPPSIAKVFTPSTIALNATTSLTFTITNPAANTVSLTGVAFTDALPTGLTVSNASATVCGGTLTVTAPTGISITGATIAASSQCQFSVTVTGAASGQYTNTTGNVTSTNGGTGNTATANLTVASPPAITKLFGAVAIPLNGTTSLTFNITNPNTTVALTGLAFTDNLPAGLVVATPSNLTSSCGGTSTAVAGAGQASLTGGTLAASGSCAVSLNVQGTTAGIKNNSVQVTSTEGGTGNTSNASITVVGAPVIIKAFGAASIPLNGSTSLSFTVQNPNTTQALSGVAFTDTLPAGLVVSTPNGLTGTCGAGTVTATAGSGTASLSGGTIAASSSCTFSINVAGTTAGTKNNTTGNVTSTEGGTGGTASASLNVIAPPSLAKAFGAATIPLNGTTSLTFTISNPPANTVAETGVAFTDTLPIGLVVATPNGATNNCGGTVTAVAGSTAISLTGGTVSAPTGACIVQVNVTGTVAGNYTNTTGSISSTNGGTGATASANLTVASPPAIVKLFGAVAIPLNGTTSLTFNITNPNTTVALTGLAFTDNLPAGLVVATPSNLTSSCGGTSTAVAGAGQASLTGGTLAASGSCAVSLNVQGTTAGIKNNSVQVTSTEGGTGNTSNTSITVVGAPVIIKAFGAASIPLNGSTSLNFTVQNPNTTQALSGVAFTDTLPAGLVVSTPNGLTGTCGAGTITGTAGTNVISLSGATLAASTSCTFSVNVTGITAGLQNNTTGNVTSTQGGTGGTASASLNVVAPPSIAKVFTPTAIALNATTSLTFTITNPAANPVSLTGVAFTDTLPTGLTVANASATVCGGTLTTTAPTGISLTGATIAANSQCQFSVTVTGAASGQYTNTTGSVSSTNGGTGNTATANLTVASPPAITKSFGAISVPVNGSTSLSFAISNPAANSVSLTGVAFTDTLPAGLVVSTPNALTNTCGGTATATAGSGAVSLTGSTLATNASCTVTVNVTATTGGVKNNSVTVTSANAGTGNTSNATLTADAPPVLVKAFGAVTIPLNGSTSLSFTVTNPNGTAALTGIGFADALPAGLVVSTPNGQSGTCGAGTITAAAGSSAVTLTGASLPAAGACTFSVNVTGAVAGAQNNTTGNITSVEGGTGGTASASVAVVAPPSISKAFTPTVINPNGTSALSFTIVNPAANSVALTGVAFTDAFPAGVTVSTPNGLTGGGSCGGTITANAGAGAVSLAGGTIAVGSTCSFSVNVTSNTPGVVTNTTSAVTSTNGGTGNTATANLTVGAPPSIAKVFGAASIGLAGSTSLSFTITNPNASIALTGVAFTDPLPVGLVVSTPNGLTGTCGAGVITAAAGSTSVALTGGTIPTTGTCTFSVNVTGVTAGAQINTTGAVSATNGGTGNTATANITVLASDLTITKGHTGNFFQGQTNATYTITVGNAGPGPSAGTVSVTDALPAGLTATGLTGTGWTCTVGTVTCTRNDALAANASYPAITVTVSVASNAAASVTNLATVSGGGELNTANDSASDVTTVTLPPDFTLAIAPPSVTVRAGQPATYGLTVTPINNAFSNAITFSVTGLPDKTSFVFTPPSVTPGANPATSSLKVLTTPGDPFLAQNNTQKSHLPLYAMFFPLTGLVLSGFGFRKRKLGAKWILGIVMFICAGFTMYGCASAGNFKKLGTTPGSYTVTVTATSGTLQHSQTVTLDVQP